MNRITIPTGYRPVLDEYDTQRAIEHIKRTFQREFAAALNLKRVSAPLFVTGASGLNDNLNGVERPVTFDVPALNAEAQVVHSLAKWKRLALKRYNFSVGNGLYTDMNAIRRDEALDNVHSLYVDQWDWEKIITREHVAAFDAGIGNFSDDVHYDLLGCLQKSIRGSDPDATAFYVAKMLALGEMFSLCRRLQVIASEDIGLAYPQAAAIVRACCESARELGMPEAQIPLIHAALLLATAPKSNSAYMALHAASEDVTAGRGVRIPVHLQSPLFKGYKYPHDYENHYVEQQYLPDDLLGRRYYVPGGNKTEQAAATYWNAIKGKPKS